MLLDEDAGGDGRMYRHYLCGRSPLAARLTGNLRTLPPQPENETVAVARSRLLHHVKAGVWLYPGGHIDPNEDPAQAAVREVREETGVEVEIVAEERFRHPAVGVVASPFAILVMPVSDSKVGPHHHIDMV